MEEEASGGHAVTGGRCAPSLLKHHRRHCRAAVAKPRSCAPLVRRHSRNLGHVPHVRNLACARRALIIAAAVGAAVAVRRRVRAVGVRIGRVRVAVAVRGGVAVVAALALVATCGCARCTRNKRSDDGSDGTMRAQRSQTGDAAGHRRVHQLQKSVTRTTDGGQLRQHGVEVLDGANEGHVARRVLRGAQACIQRDTAAQRCKIDAVLQRGEHCR